MSIKPATPKLAAFNPARLSGTKGTAHAFAAKVWECMRRNDELRDALKGLRQKAPTAAAQQAFQRAMSQNEFAFMILGTVVLTNAPEIDAIKKTIEFTPWPCLPIAMQSAFEQLALELAPLPRIVPPPPVSPAKISASGMERTLAPKLLHTWLSIAPVIWGNWHVIAIPKNVLHDRHVKLVQTELRKLIGDAKRSWVQFKPGGKILGSAVDWDVFLFIEDLESKKVKRELAMHQAAWKFYKKDSYDSHREDRFTKLGLSDAKEAYRIHGGHISTRFSAIKDAVKSVYPAMSPFYVG
jgi:hypothetical protein